MFQTHRLCLNQWFSVSDTQTVFKAAVLCVTDTQTVFKAVVLCVSDTQTVFKAVVFCFRHTDCLKRWFSVSDTQTV